MIDTTCPGCDRAMQIEEPWDSSICSACNRPACDLMYGALAQGTAADVAHAVDVCGRLALIPAGQEVER